MRGRNDGASVSAGQLDTSISAVWRRASLRHDAINRCTPCSRMLPSVIRAGRVIHLVSGAGPLPLASPVIQFVTLADFSFTSANRV